jgi:bifunctional non-homologous end joining protein LigD
MDGELAGTPFRPLRLHRIYRLIVVREDKLVRLITRNGHDWSGRYPWMVESALNNRPKHFVIDG